MSKRNPTGLAVAALVFTACSCLAACVLAAIFHGLTPGIARISLLSGGLAAWAAWRKCPAENRPERMRILDWAIITVYALVSLRSFLWLVFTTNNNLSVLSPNNLGDLTKHWNYILYMAGGCTFWPDNPILAGTGIRYPIGMDLFNSLLVLCGVDIIRSLIWVGLAGSLISGIALFRWGRSFAIAGLLFNGGIQGFAFFETFEFHDYQAESAWKNLFLSIIITQRGFIYCLPAGLLLLKSWRDRITNRPGHLPFFVECLLYASIPLFHVHTFIFLSILLGFWALAGPGLIRGYAWKLGLASLVPASLLVALDTEFFKSPSFIKFHPGWMQNETPFFHFWFGNFGILLPLALLLLSIVCVKKDRASAAFVVPACGIFTLCCFFLFAPWDWDNTKLMIWSYLVILPFLREKILAGKPLWLQTGLCVVLFLSGFISLFGGLGGQGHPVAERSEIDSLAAALKSIPISARFAAAPEYNHPLILLGRKVAMGYPGHLFGHGLPYRGQEKELNNLMKGGSGWDESAKRLGIDYLFWGEEEEEYFTDSSKPWMKELAVYAKGGHWELYRIGQ